MLKKSKNFILGYIISIFLSIYPISQLFFNNLDVLNYQQTAIPLLILFIIATFLYLGFSIIIKESNTKVILVPFIIIILFSYNYIHIFLSTQSNLLNYIGRNRILIPLLFISLTFFVYWIMKSSFVIKKALFIFLIVLNTIPFSKLFYIQRRGYPISLPLSSSQKIWKGSENFPDVFLIILDMYPSNLVLEQYFEFNNKNFTNKLESLGFNVFYNSRSNYSRTLLSLTSTLNMEYLNEDTESSHKELTLQNLYHKLENGKVQSFFKKKGYNFYWFEGGYLPGKSQYNYNEFFIPVNGTLYSRQETVDNDFLIYFINNSIISPIAERIKIIAVDIFRKRIDNIFIKLPVLASNKDHKFVFAHFIAPHPPFVFGENGDKVYYDENSRNSKTAFINQLKYINKRLINTLEKILSIDNGRNKIIIIQGDHGTREIIPNNIYSFNQHWAREAFGNLNAVYFSDKLKNKKVNYHSPVNTFRFILNLEFNQNIVYLEDINYYTDYTFPLKLHRIHNEKSH
jgi:hypothetical protein